MAVASHFRKFFFLMSPVRRFFAERPRSGGAASRPRGEAARGRLILVAFAATLVGIAACSSGGTASSPSTAAKSLRPTTTVRSPAPRASSTTTRTSGAAPADAGIIDAAKFGGGWSRRVTTGAERSASDSALRSRCPSIGEQLALVDGARSRAVYRGARVLPQIVIDRRESASKQGRDTLVVVGETLKSAALERCLTARAEAEPVSLRDVSLTRLQFDPLTAAFGFRVRGLHGASAATELVLIETIVLVTHSSVTIATISSSGRNPVDVTLTAAVARALEGH